MRPRDLLLLTVGGAEVASTRYRVLAHRPALEEAGYRTELRPPLRRSGALRPVARALDLARDAFGRSPAPLWLVQRKTFPPAVAPRLRRSGRFLLFDVDDAIDLPPPSHPAAGSVSARYRRNFVATVEQMDLVICGNLELARRLPHDRFEIVPTPVDTERFAPGAVGRGNGATLGWVGHSDNLRFLEALAEPLRELCRRRSDVRLVVVADRPPAIDGVPLEFRRWRLDDEVTCFDGIDVGLMPLDDTPWTRAKCAFKAIQYMALGIPTVASPVGANRELIADGVSGFLPGDGAAWIGATERLVTDTAAARRIGEAGRATVERDYSLSAISKRVVAILDAVVARKVASSTSDVTTTP